MIVHTFIFSLILGLIMTVVIVANEDFENKKTGFLISAILLIIFTSIFYGLSSYYDKAQIDAWNNSICTECGGEYKFKSAYNSSYFYACEDCDHVIKLEELKK